MTVPVPFMPEPDIAPPPGREPRGYFLALSTVTDVARFHQYRSVVAKLREVYEGRELVRAARVLTVKGSATEELLTLVEHPTVSDLRMLLAAPEYVALGEKLRSLAPGPTWVARGLWPVREPLPPGPGPRAYAVALYRIEKPARFHQFRELIARVIAAHGGRFLVRLDPLERLGGPADDRLLSIVEFPSLRKLQFAVDSQDYKDLSSMDLGHGVPTIWVVEGV